MTASTRNILRTLRGAISANGETKIISMRDWYRRAARLAMELDPTNPRRAAAVIAVLSPRTSWPMNVRLARQAYYLHLTQGWNGVLTLPTLGDHARKAARLLSGENPDSVVSGPKVTAFFRTIADPTLTGAVVVDRHAIDVAFGRVTSDSVRAPFLTARRYGEVAGKYERAAKIISRETGETWLPSEVQAVTWAHWRETMALANHGDVA